MKPSSSMNATTTATTSTHASPPPPHGSSIGHLLRGVLQSVKKRRKRNEREKYLRAIEKSGVDFASALLLSNRISSTQTSTSTNSSLSLSFNTSRMNQTSTQTLDRVEKLQVRTTVENVRESVTLVTLQLVLASPQREVSLPQQQQQPQQQQLVLGKSTVVVISTGVRPQQQQPRRHELTRPFDDFRRLRKMLAFCARQGRHEEEEHETGKTACCAYCSEVRAYVAQCWERPPLLETSMLSSMTVIRKGVLGSSLMHFVRLARSTPVFPLQRSSSGGAAVNNSTSAAADCSGDPMCAAHSEIATILHDFFRLQQRTR